MRAAQVSQPCAVFSFHNVFKAYKSAWGLESTTFSINMCLEIWKWVSATVIKGGGEGGDPPVS